MRGSRARVASFESLDPRRVLSVTTVSPSHPPQPSAPPSAISDPALAGLTGTALLNAALAKVGPALVVNTAGGDFETSLASGDVEQLKATAAAQFVGPLVPEGFLDGYTSPLFASTDMPTAIEFDGQDNVNDTLNLDLSALPRNEDGSLVVKSIVYNGGARRTEKGSERFLQSRPNGNSR